VRELTTVKDLVGSLERRVAPERLVRAALQPRTHPRDVLAHALRGPRRYVAAAVVAASLGVSLLGLASPPQQDAAPVDLFVARHASVADVQPVIFTVPSR
jgi:hypothetical protein